MKNLLDLLRACWPSLRRSQATLRLLDERPWQKFRVRPCVESLEDRMTPSTGVTGGGLPFDNMQPSLALNYVIATQGIFPARNDAPEFSGGMGAFVGEVRLFAGNFAPQGWSFADGQLLRISQNTALFSLLGNVYGGDGQTTFALPDLRGRVAVQQGQGPGLTQRDLGGQFGGESVTLTEAQLPAHTHTVGADTTGATGGGQPFDNDQPSLGLNFIVAPLGIYQYVGEVRMFAGNFPPSGGPFTDGQLLSIADYDAFFSKIGTTYGGDGQTTFAVPDLRGRVPVGEGPGPGLTARTLGQLFGVEAVTLTQAQIPAHGHTIEAGTTGATGGGQPHENTQPSLTLNYMIAVQGVFPGGLGNGGDGVPTLAEVRPFATDVQTPKDWLPADGRLLPINTNQALFALLGTTYGGDGRVNFALPDLRGRTPIGAGQGPGLTNRVLGEKDGGETGTLTVAELPPHDHAVPTDLTLSNAHSGSTLLGGSFTWTLRVANEGALPVTFAAGQTIVLDNLPTQQIQYGVVTFSDRTNLSGAGALGGSIDADGNLTVTVSGGPMALGALTGGFTVSFTATPGAALTFANPRSGGTARVDPYDLIAEDAELNNAASDSVTVIAVDFGDAPARVPGADQDGDGVPDTADNSPFVANPAQVDTDGDGAGDASDPEPTNAAVAGNKYNYKTALAQDGARHVIGGPRLGAGVDPEADGQPNLTATGDGGDDDGVTLGPLAVSASSSTTGGVTVDLQNAPGARLDAWIDFNQDGDWADADEQIFTGRALAAGPNLLTFTVPAGARAGTSYARFRVSSAGGLAPTGLAADGEVEDYAVTLVPRTASVAVSPTSVTEGVAGTLTFTFALSEAAAGDTLVNFDVGGSATFTSDYTQTGAETFTGTSGSVKVLGGATTAQVVLTPVDDTVVEGSETVRLTVAAGSGYSPASPTSASGTINDNDTATVTFSSPTSSAAEGGADATVGVTLSITANGVANSGTLGSAVSVDLTGAGSGVDFTLPGSPTVTFAGGSASGSQSVTVAAIDDTLVEGKETFTLVFAHLSDPTGQVSTSGSNALTFTDNDTATIRFATDASSAAEGGADATVGVTLSITANGVTSSGTLASAVSVDLAGAGSGVDFTLPGSPMVTFAAGSASGTQNATVAVVNDMIVEGTETFALGFANLSDPTGQVTASGGNTLTITDNDTATVGFQAAGSSAGENDGGKGVAVVLTINASGTGTPALGSDLTVDLTTTGGSATGGADYSLPATPAVTFAAGDYASGADTQTATVGITSDRLVEGDETADLALSIAQNIGTQASVSGTTSHTLTVTDDDTATVSFAASGSTVGEATPAHEVTAKLSITAVGTVGTAQLDRAVSVDVSDAGGGTATGGGTDYTATTQTLTFGVGSLDGATQTTGGLLGIVNDALVEGDETVLLGLAINSDATGGQVTASGGRHTATLLDNDTATVSFASASGSVAETTPSHDVGVTLTITADGTGPVQLAHDVSVDVQDALTGTASSGSDYTYSSPQTLTFLSGDAGSTKTVSVGVTDDNLSEGNEMVRFQLAGLVDGTGGQARLMAPTSHTVTIVDNDVDLRVTTAESNDPVAAGSGPGNLTYTVTVANVGLTDATGVKLSDVLSLPAGVTVVSVTPSAGAVTPNSVTDYTWDLGNLPVGGSQTLTVVWTVGAASAPGADVVGNKAAVTTAVEDRVNTPDDTATERTTVARLIDLKVAVKDNVPVRARPGDLITYTLTFGNAGVSDATGVVLTETLPANTTADPANLAAGWVDAGGGRFTFHVGDLPAGVLNRTVTFATRVSKPLPRGVHLLTDLARITDDGSAIEQHPANNTAREVTHLNSRPVARPDAFVTRLNRAMAVWPWRLFLPLAWLNRLSQPSPFVRVTGRVLSNDTDADGDRLTAKLVKGPSRGKLRFHRDGSFIYRPPAGYVGRVTFTYRAFDGVEYSAPVTVTIDVRLPVRGRGA